MRISYHERKLVTQKSTPDGEKRPFAATLHDLNKGRTHTQLGDELRDLVAAVVQTGKPGRLTLQLDVKRQSGDHDAVTITAKVGSKIPVFDSPASTFFVDDDGGLSRTPPRQPSMFDTADLGEH